jgi:hypothetical protein
MCGECERIDVMIEHYREMLNPAVDQFTQGMVAALIEDLKADKVTLHPQEEK